MKKIGLLLATYLFAVSAFAQTTVSPLVAEFEARSDTNAISNGEVTVRNDSIFPMLTTVEALSFRLSDVGAPTFQPLVDNISVQWENPSARIPAKQEHVFYYRATCKVAPCWFLILSTAMGPRPKNADGPIMQVSLRLPTVAYVYGKTPVQPDELSLHWKGSDLYLVNQSAQIVRTVNVEIHTRNGVIVKSGAFPLFPKGISGSDHVMHFAERPDYVVVKVRCGRKSFSLDTRHLQ